MNQNNTDSQPTDQFREERLSLLGSLTAGVAHELNNPIGYIASNINSLSRYAHQLVTLVEHANQVLNNTDTTISDADQQQWQTLLKQAQWEFMKEDLPSLLEDTNTGALQLKSIVADLKILGRSGHTPEIVNANDCVRSALTILGHKLKRGVTVDQQLGHIPVLSLVRAHIIQACTNIIHNAIQAGATHICISSYAHHATGGIHICFADNGSGIDEHLINSIFDRHFTTKEQNGGNGLGLGIVSDIAHKHNGTISCQGHGELGGATFTLSLNTAS